MFHVTQNGHTDMVFLKVENHAEQAARKLQKFHGHGLFHAVNLGHAVADRQDGPGLGDLDLLVIVLYLGFYYFTYFFRSDFHNASTP